MGTYRQYCPMALASEILAERWNLLIIRNLMFGASTFGAIAGGVPHMSRSMLAKRLRELQRDGVVDAEAKQAGRGSTYRLTAAGRDLGEVVDALASWGERWVDIRPEHTDPGFALWAWCQVQLEKSLLPGRRTVVAFTFPEEPPGNRRFWLLVDRGTAEACVDDPGGEPAAYVTAQSRAFIDWHRGALEWASARRSGAIEVTGRRDVVRALPTWNRRPTVSAAR